MGAPITAIKDHARLYVWKKGETCKLADKVANCKSIPGLGMTSDIQDGTYLDDLGKVKVYGLPDGGSAKIQIGIEEGTDLTKWADYQDDEEVVMIATAIVTQAGTLVIGQQSEALIKSAKLTDITQGNLITADIEVEISGKVTANFVLPTA